MKELNKLKNRISTFAVFRDLLRDPVITALYEYLRNPAISLYAEFVSRLYTANGGNISEYIKELCENSENVYVKAVASGKEIPKEMFDAVLEELNVLQAVADLTPEMLSAAIQYEGWLPKFTNAELDLTSHYMHRAEHIGKYGYGIYAKNRMFYIDGADAIVPVHNADTIRFSDLADYERERKRILDNTNALLLGKPAANILLTGDAGTGKSSTVKAVVNEIWRSGLRMIEVRKDQLRAIPKILNELSQNPLKFILFVDDLSFLKDDDNFHALKAVLEGSVTVKSRNVVIYATSNRRHIIKETFSDREGDDVHRNDTLQELLSLSERFGIHITFSKPNKETYLKIIHHVAEENGIVTDEALDLLAERFALERGGRSARLARQFIDGLLSKQGD